MLLGLLGSTNPKQQLDGAVALYRLANKSMTLSPVDAAPPSPTPQVSFLDLIVPCYPLFYVVKISDLIVEHILKLSMLELGSIYVVK